jgi:trehalose 6-phosphate phosphatase
MAFDIRPRGAHKGAVVDMLMSGAPFRGRVPVFIGDDVTDRDGFAAAHRHHGYGVQVGARPVPSADFTIASPAALRAWLAELAATESENW